MTSARACSLAKINFLPHETRGSYRQGSRVGKKIMITTSCLRLRSGGSPIRAGPPEDPLRLDGRGCDSASRTLVSWMSECESPSWRQLRQPAAASLRNPSLTCARCHRNQAGALAGLRVGRARLCSGQLSHRRTRTFTVAAAGTHLSLRSDKSLRQSESGSEADHGSRATGPEKSAGLPSARSRRRQSHESTQADFESRLGVGSSAGRQGRQRRQRPRAAAGLTEVGTGRGRSQAAVELESLKPEAGPRQVPFQVPTLLPVKLHCSGIKRPGTGPTTYEIQIYFLLS